MNWMTSAKKRMKKGRRSIDDAMRLNNPYAKSRNKPESTNGPINRLYNSSSVAPSKRGMSKDEIMITNFASSTERQQQQQTSITRQSAIDHKDPFDNLNMSPPSPIEDKARESHNLELCVPNLESPSYIEPIVVGRKREKPEPCASINNSILFFNEGTAFREKTAYAFTPAEDQSELENSYLEEGDEAPLDLQAFLFHAKLVPTFQKTVKDDSPKKSGVVQSKDDFYSISAKFGLFSQEETM